MTRRTNPFIAALAIIVGEAFAAGAAAQVPKVELSKAEQALCKLKVGDAMPKFELPKVDGDNTSLADLMGKKATVVVFWKGDRRMSREQLADMEPDVVKPFADKGVVVVGIVVNEAPKDAQATLHNSKAAFANLIDAGGKAFAQIGSQRLPRTFVLDASGKIVWFDIEYSLMTRRELKQTLNALVGDAAAPKE
jgi:peroxiredoxin